MNKNERKRILNVEEQKYITTYLNYGLPLCSILWNKKKFPWMIEHFNNLYSMRDEKGYLWVDYLEETIFTKNVIKFTEITKDEMKKVKNIIHYLKEKINTGQYVMLFVDKFYIRNTTAYKQKHNWLQLFIYGYDAEQEVIYGVGFDSKGNFKKTQYSYSEVEQGFNSCVNSELQSFKKLWIERSCVILMELKDVEEVYPFHVDIFLKQMENYLTSKKLTEELRQDIITERGAEARYGLDAVKDIIKGLHELAEGKFNMDYRFIHILVERQRLMYEKVVFLSNYFHLEDELKDIEQEYLMLKKKMDRAKFNYMKGLLCGDQEMGIYGQLKDVRCIEGIADTCQMLIDKEKEILPELIRIIRKKMGEEQGK